MCKTTIMYGDQELTEEDKQLMRTWRSRRKRQSWTNVIKFIFDKQPDTIAQAEADRRLLPGRRVKDYSLFWVAIRSLLTVDERRRVQLRLEYEVRFAPTSIVGRTVGHPGPLYRYHRSFPGT